MIQNKFTKPQYMSGKGFVAKGYLWLPRLYRSIFDFVNCSFFMKLATVTHWGTLLSLWKKKYCLSGDKGIEQDGAIPVGVVLCFIQAVIER